MERNSRVLTERASHVVENVHPPSYQASQSNFGAAQENVERIVITGNEDTKEYDEKSPEVDRYPSPAYTHATPESRLTSRSPAFTDSSPLTIDTPSATLRTTRSFSFTPTIPPSPVVDRGQAKESLPREQADLEVFRPGNYDKEVYLPDLTEKEVNAPKRKSSYGLWNGEGTEGRPPRRKLWLILTIATLLIVAIILGVGLGVGLKKHKSTSTDLRSGGSLNPEYFSTEGAFNGSGIALASQSFQGDEQGTMVLYYQHFAGTIRWKMLRSGNWIGGTQSEIVASDAKNGTPISAVAYALHNVSTWHIFYINEANLLRQKTNSNVTNIWQDGPVNNLNLTALDADSVGMQACWYGSFFGDTDYDGLKPTVASDGQNVTTYSANVGMHLWYASDATTFQQYGWRDGQEEWVYQNNWTEKNGHAGVGCYTWGPGTVTYTMMVNLENTVEIWWKDTDTNLTSTEAHPINVWTNASIAIPNVDPSTSLGYTTFLYAQDASTHRLGGYNITWHAEHTSLIAADTLVVDGPAPPLPGSHFSVSAINDKSGGESLIVFYQMSGDDVTESTRDLYGGAWSYSEVGVEDG